MAGTARQAAEAATSIVPANEASWEDLRAVSGARGVPARCQCELYVGSRSIFADAGFTEVSHPTPRRVVMRIDFRPGT